MKKSNLLFSACFLFFSLLSTVTLHAQAPNWLWAKSAGGNGFDFWNCITVSSADNVYVAGAFGSSDITIGTSVFNNHGANTPDIVVAKYDLSGSVIWAKSFGGSSYDVAKCVAYDASGNVYFTGYYNSDSISFESFTLHNPNNNSDAFLVKLDANGNVLWAKSITGNNSDVGVNLMVNNQSLIVGGNFTSDTLYFDNNHLIVNNAPGSNDAFVAKYDLSGNYVWSQAISGSDEEAVNGISVDNNGNFLVVGSFKSDSLHIGNMTKANDTANLTSDIFIAKFDNSGAILWLHTYGGTDEDIAWDIATDATTGNSVIVGSFASDNIVFGSQQHSNLMAGVPDMFVLKISNTGAETWSKSYGTASAEEFKKVALDNSGNAYVSGYFSGNSVSFGIIVLNKLSATPNFILKLDHNGSELWAKMVTTQSFYPNIAVDATQHCLLAGAFSVTNLVLGSISLANAGLGDMYLAKLDAVLDINDVYENSMAVVYPNPATTSATIHLKNNVTDASIQLYNAQGSLVKEMSSLTGNDFILNTNKLSTGLYFIHLTELKTSKEIRLKLVVE